MINLPYSLIIEATDEPDFFGFYSDELRGFSGVGHSIEGCLCKAAGGMQDHLITMKEQGLTVPPVNANPEIIIRNQVAEPA